MPFPNRGAQEVAAKVAPPKVTQASIARACGKTPQAVSHWLNNISRPDEASKAIIEELLGVDRSLWDVPLDQKAG